MALDFVDILSQAVQKKASDVHIVVDLVQLGLSFPLGSLDILAALASLSRDRVSGFIPPDRPRAFCPLLDCSSHYWTSVLLRSINSWELRVGYSFHAQEPLDRCFRRPRIVTCLLRFYRATFQRA